MPVSESFAKGFALPLPSDLADEIGWDFKNRSFSERFPHKLPQHASETVWRRRPHQSLSRSFKPHSYAPETLGPYRSNYYSTSSALSRQDLSNQPKVPLAADAAVHHPSRFHLEGLSLESQQDMSIRAHSQAYVGVPAELRGKLGRNTTTRLPHPLDYSYTTKIDVATGKAPASKVTESDVNAGKSQDGSASASAASDSVFSRSASTTIFGSPIVENTNTITNTTNSNTNTNTADPRNPFRRPCPDPLYKRTSDAYGSFALDDPASKHFIFFPRQHTFSTALSAGR